MSKLCLKCGNMIPDENIRTYKLSLKKNLSSSSVLRRLEEVNLCYECDALRKVPIGRYITTE